MPATLTVRDETTFRHASPSAVWTLAVPTERVTVQELIRARVYQEVADYNALQPDYFRGLVQPTDAERTLNGFKLPKGRQVDAEEQFYQALLSFQSNGFILLVDDRQVDDLDETIEIGPNTSVTFLKLIPLVGG
ncbi:MAG: hypothetical protein M3220_01515 [Chloroflexota bacterium]|nr:hypothetical protein [Chloroflexota bacterium]